MMDDKYIKIINIKFNTGSYDDILSEILSLVDSNKKNYIVTPNPEFILEAEENERFKDILNNAVISIPDGIGILWAAKYLSLQTSKYPVIKHIQSIWQLVYTELSLLFYPSYCRSIIPERITGSDLVYKILGIAAQNSLKIYFLGAQPGIAKKASNIIKEKYPNIQIVGAQSGSPRPEDDPKLVADINDARPDILFVAYGAPKQEYWIDRNLSKLNTVKIAMGVGGAFDFISGNIKRAPKIMGKFGLEWLYRLVKEPSRVKRIYNATIKFPIMILKYKIK